MAEERKPVFTPAQKLGWTVGLGVLGIALSTMYFAPAEMPFWAEFSKFAPGVIIPAVGLFVADWARSEARNSRETAEGARDEARAGREAGERAEVEARSGREAGERAEVEARSGRERAEEGLARAERTERAVIGPRSERTKLRREEKQKARSTR